MFNFFFNSLQAYNQVGLFLAALVCLGIGGLILGTALYWRVHALRASGTIIGVIGKGTMFTPVYRYTLPDGQTHEAKSDVSSGGVRGKETGRVVPLMISAHNPTEARAANSYLLDIIGLVLIAPGILCAYIAFTAYPVTQMTWIMSAALLLYLAERGRRIFIPKGQRVSLEDWKKQYGMDGTASIDLTQVKPIEEIVATPDKQQARTLQMQKNRKAAPFIGIFAVILGCIGVYQGIKTARLESTGLRAQGTVVRMKEERHHDKHGTSYSYYAIVDYRTEQNMPVEFKDSVGSNPPGHHEGDTVTVLYLADNPQKEAIIDRGIWNWTASGVLFLFAMLMMGIAVKTLRAGETAGKP